MVNSEVRSTVRRRYYFEFQKGISSHRPINKEMNKNDKFRFCPRSEGFFVELIP
jgi:hypothetical protein